MILVVVLRNKFQWLTRWAKFLSTVANAFLCIVSVISTTFCVVLVIHFIQSKCAQMPECMGSFIHYSFVFCCWYWSMFLCIRPCATPKRLIRFIAVMFNEFQVFPFWKKWIQTYVYLLLLRFKDGYVKIIRIVIIRMKLGQMLCQTNENSKKKWLKVEFFNWYQKWPKTFYFQEKFKKLCMEKLVFLS